MKTAISIPDHLFLKADEFARQRNMSRSALFSVAIAQYLEQHNEDAVTQRLNAVFATEESSPDPILTRLQVLSLPEEDW